MSHTIKGRLTFATFFKTCLLAGLGFWLIGLLVTSVWMVGHFLWIGADEHAVPRDVSRVYEILYFLLVSAGTTLVWMLSLAILGYPLYWWFAKIRGGLTVRVVAGDVSDRQAFLRFLRLWFPCFLKVLPVVLVLSGAVAAVQAVREIPYYRAASMVLLTSDLPVERVQEVRWEEQPNVILTQVPLMNSSHIQREARKRLGRPQEEIREKIKSVSVNALWRTSIIQVTVEAYDPVLAAEYANAIVDVYMEYAQADGDRPFLIQVLQRAQPATEPASPGIVQRILAAMGIGLLIALALSILWAALRYHARPAR